MSHITTYTNPALRTRAARFARQFIAAVVDSNDSDFEDIRNCTFVDNDIDVSDDANDVIYGAQFPDVIWGYWVLKDQIYDISSGYTLPCVDYTAAGVAYDQHVDDDDMPTGYEYWIKVKAMYYEAGNVHSPDPAFPHLTLQVYVCMNGEYGQDNDPGFGSGAYEDQTRGGWEHIMPLKRGSNLSGARAKKLASVARAEFRKARMLDCTQCDVITLRQAASSILSITGGVPALADAYGRALGYWHIVQGEHLVKTPHKYADVVFLERVCTEHPPLIDNGVFTTKTIQRCVLALTRGVVPSNVTVCEAYEGADFAKVYADLAESLAPRL